MKIEQRPLECGLDDGKSALSERELTERRTIQDWVVRPLLRGIPGVADINSIGGLEKQYQVLVDPDRLRHYGVPLKDVYTALANNNANSGGGVLRRQAEQYLVAASVSSIPSTTSPASC